MREPRTGPSRGISTRYFGKVSSTRTPFENSRAWQKRALGWAGSREVLAGARRGARFRFVYRVRGFIFAGPIGARSTRTESHWPCWTATSRQGVKQCFAGKRTWYSKQNVLGIRARDHLIGTAFIEVTLRKVGPWAGILEYCRSSRRPFSIPSLESDPK